MTDPYKAALKAVIGTPQKEIEEQFVSIGEMQRKIMPEPHRVRLYSCYDVYGGTLPVQWVGGDFYDFIELDRFGIKEKLGVVIADVSGHGLSAAMLVRDFNTALYTAVAFEAHYAQDTTPLLFEKINSRMFRSSLDNQYVTSFYGELHPDGTLRYINAGHFPPLVLQGRETIKLDRGGPVLGAFDMPPSPYQTGEVTLRDQDVLVAYTDGITEAVSPDGEEYGVKRLAKAVRDRGEAPARRIFEAVMGDVDQFAAGEQYDDRTLIVIRKDDC